MRKNASLDKHPGLDEWLSIGADGRVIIRTGKVDIGQRISTALALIAAEELDIDYDRIDVSPVETGQSPNEGFTSGSNSMEESGEAVKLAAATARAHLLQLAAEALEVDASTLDVEDGLIQSRATNRSVTYGDLMGDARFNIEIDRDATPKDPKTYRQIGTKVIPRGFEAIITGKAHFLHDMTMPDMLHARIVRPPHYTATLSSLDEDAAKRIAEGGVELVRDGSFLALVGEDEYATFQAIERLQAACVWDTDAGLEPQDIFERLRSNERISLTVVDGTPNDDPVPDLADPPIGAASTLRASYDKPYQMHGTIGPSAAMAQWQDDRLTVWTHSQGIYILRAAMADALEMDVEALTLIHVPGAGCYGHNGADDAALDAALIARAIPGRPILLKWTREDEHAWEPYGSCMGMDLQASLDEAGNIIAWSQDTYSDTHVMRPRPAPNRGGAARLLAARYMEPPMAPPVPPPNRANNGGIHRNLDPLYDFPDKRLIKHLVRGLPLRTSALRTLGAYGNIFAIESFMDEMADAAGIDPVTFRLNHLSDSRACDVIKAAAERFGWNNWQGAEGRGRGIAFARYKNSKTYAAVAIELEVTDKAEARLIRAMIAADAGQVVDAAGLEAQMEGGLIQAASWTLHEQVTFDQGGITSRDWDTYPILGFDNIPEIETILMQRPGEPFLGAGEATAGPTAAAIANAIANATGLRLRRLPFTPDAIRAAAIA
jgi:CO/xanthine dehydrogenase Mo-binding subunit